MLGRRGAEESVIPTIQPSQCSKLSTNGIGHDLRANLELLGPPPLVSFYWG